MCGIAAAALPAGASAAFLSQIPQEISRCILLKPRKYLGQIPVPEVPVHGFAEHLPEVSGYGQIAAFIQVLCLESRPVAVNFSAFDRAAKDEHHVGMSVVGAAIPVLAHGAAKL